MIRTIFATLFVCYVVSEAAVVPDVPSPRRVQYSYLLNDGSYKYGFDTNTKEKLYAKQEAQLNNEVKGKFGFKDANEIVNIEYTSGVRGFIPKGHFAENIDLPKYNWEAEQTLGNPAYNFAFKEQDQARDESSDSAGNVRGSYSYQDEAGTHELSYISGIDGYKVTGGNLANAYSLVGRSPGYQSQWKTELNALKTANVKATIPASDGSYGFDYSADDHSRTETTDAEGNVIGSYSYVDATGRHEVKYKAGPKIGFVITNDESAQSNIRASAAGQSAQNSAGRDTFKFTETKFQSAPSASGTFLSTQASSGLKNSNSFQSTHVSSGLKTESSNFYSTHSSSGLKTDAAAEDPAALKIFNVSYKEGSLKQYQPSAENPKYGYAYEASN